MQLNLGLAEIITKKQNKTTNIYIYKYIGDAHQTHHQAADLL